MDAKSDWPSATTIAEFPVPVRGAVAWGPRSPSAAAWPMDGSPGNPGRRGQHHRSEERGERRLATPRSHRAGVCALARPIGEPRAVIEAWPARGPWREPREGR